MGMYDEYGFSKASYSRESIEELWETFYPIREGMIIPRGMEYIVMADDGVKYYVASGDIDTDIYPPHVIRTIRTADPIY